MNAPANLLVCWLLGHHWLETGRVNTASSDDVSYECARCKDTCNGDPAQLIKPRRPAWAAVMRASKQDKRRKA
jgi:hypothetical protein